MVSAGCEAQTPPPGAKAQKATRSKHLTDQAAARPADSRSLLVLVSCGMPSALARESSNQCKACRPRDGILPNLSQNDLVRLTEKEQNTAGQYREPAGYPMRHNRNILYEDRIL